MNATEDGTEPLGESPALDTSEATEYSPIHEVTYYQARCTSCGHIEDDYGDFTAWGDRGDAISSVVDAGWFERYRDEPAPTPEMPRRIISHTIELLCLECIEKQVCDVCQGAEGVQISTLDDNHLVCANHDDHDFVDAAPAGGERVSRA